MSHGDLAQPQVHGCSPAPAQEQAVLEAPKICCPRPRSLRCICGEPVTNLNDCCCRKCFLEFQADETASLDILAEVVGTIRPSSSHSSQKARAHWRPDSHDSQGTSEDAKPFSESPLQVREDEEAANEGVPEKQCTRCLAHLPLTDFCVNKRSPDGRFTQCRACVAEKDRQRYRKRQRRGHGPLVPTKVCSCCHEEKSKEEFHRDPSKSLGLQTYCKACLAMKQAARKAQLK